MKSRVFSILFIFLISSLVLVGAHSGESVEDEHVQTHESEGWMSNLVPGGFGLISSVIALLVVLLIILLVIELRGKKRK